MENEKPIRQSRWVTKSAVPRYDKKSLDAIMDNFHEDAGWRNGAKLRGRAR